jgi:hypothetical protein
MKRWQLCTALGLAFAVIAVLGNAAPAAPPSPITGTTPSGGTFTLRVRVTSGGGACESLRLRLKDDRAASRSCQPRRGTGAHGLWHAACTSGDLAVYGTAYARGASAAFRTRSRRIVRAQTRPFGGRKLFVVIVGRSDLPGRLRVRRSDGRTLAKLDFGTMAQLCGGSAKGTPLDASYSF